MCFQPALHLYYTVVRFAKCRQVMATNCCCVIRRTLLCSSNVTEPFSIKIFFPLLVVNLTWHSFMQQVWGIRLRGDVRHLNIQTDSHADLCERQQKLYMNYIIYCTREKLQILTAQITWPDVAALWKHELVFLIKTVMINKGWVKKMFTQLRALSHHLTSLLGRQAHLLKTLCVLKSL